MKILEVTLINFARIYSGLEKTTLTIDFRNVKERINLFVGPNGSGKTSILRCLQPFAYNNGMGDNTSNSNFIIAGKDGKKMLTILADNGKIYDIQHIYTRKKDDTISVKSYIQEDGVELNDSGTVTTFKTVVKEKLGIDEYFLTLLSMSNSVKGFVEFTSGDRKLYASKIFSILEIYNQKYKGLTTQDRNIKALLSNVTSKLSRYQNINKEDLKQALSEANKNLDLCNTKKTQIVQSIGGIRMKLNTYHDIIKDHDSCENELRELLLSLTDIQSKLSTNMSEDELSSEIARLTIESLKLDEVVNGLKSDITRRLDVIDSKKVNLHSIETNLEKFSESQHVSELVSLKDTIISEMNAIKESYNINYDIGMTKDDFIKGVMYLDTIKEQCSDFIFQVNKQDSIIESINLYKKNNNCISTLENKLDKLENELAQYSAITGRPVNVYIPDIKYDCNVDSSCAYKEFYDRYREAIKMSQDDIHDKIMNLQVKMSKVRDTLTACNIYRKLIEMINSYKKYIPDCIFDKDTFVERYLDDRTIYNVEECNTIVDTLENIERYRVLEKELSDVEDKIKLYSTTEELRISLENERTVLTADIDKLSIEVDKLREEYTVKLEESDVLTASVEKYKEDKDRYQVIHQIEDSISLTKSKLSQMDDKMNEIESLKMKLNEYVSEDAKLTSDIANINKQKETMIISLSNIEALETEEIEIRNKYDLINNIRWAVSPTTGLPVEYIEYYMKEEMADRINFLLDSVYHGRMKLYKEGIEVNDKEFRIPYLKNGMVIDDISSASDGEKAVLGLAFSLVLIQLTQTDMDKMYYDILLLDEKDATLDNESRSKFLDLLETYMNSIGAEQLFLISHNNMFDSYPVNVLLTGETQTFNYTQASILELYM